MDGHLRYYIDGSANQKNWMKFVRCARHVAEQNLVLVQQEYSLYYEATRVITEGVELKVWYGDGYMVFMGIPLGLKIEQEGELHAKCGQELINGLLVWHVDNQMTKCHEYGLEGKKC